MSTQKLPYHNVAVAQVKDGKVIARFNSCTEAAKSLGVDLKSGSNNIASCVRKERKSAFGYQWFKLTIIKERVL